MRLAFVYAGQGSQKPGMGRDFYEEYPQVRPIFDARPLDLDLKALCFAADAATLAQTRHTQPCMGAFAAAVTLLLREGGLESQAALGLSLGEYGALHAAGVFDAESLLELLAFRGRAMEEAAAGIDSAMCAVFGLDAELVELAVAKAQGQVWCCNYNCPGQVVIGGEAGAVADAVGQCGELGTGRYLPLRVSGPFHTPLMAPASRALAEKFAQMRLDPPSIPVIANVTGEEYPLDGVAEMLARQVMAPVRLEDGLRRLLCLGIDRVVEIGPGRAIAGFLRKIAPEVRVYAVEDVAGLQDTLAALKEEGQ